MRNFQKLDPAALKAFYYAAESLNFTKAAELAALTQSGVSQHIAKLESELGVNLFHRAARKIQLTEAGKKLKTFAERYIDQLDSLLDDLNTEGQTLKGLVRYAMPDSCLMSPHFSILLSKRKKFPDVTFKITICDSQKVCELLLNGDIDFGFITTDFQHKDIIQNEFVREEYVLAGPTEESVNITNLKDLKTKNFIKYPGMDSLFQNWISTYYQKANLQINDLNITGEMNSLRGAITMTQGGLGLSIFPKHCIEPQLNKKDLYLFEGHTKTKSTHPIFIVQPSNKYPTARVKKVLEVFWEMKK